MIPAGLDRAIEDELALLCQASGAIGQPVMLSPERLLMRGRALVPPGQTSANGSCHLFRAADGWLAINLARPDDVRALPAWLEAELPADPFPGLEAFLSTRLVAPLLAQAAWLGLPVAAVGEAQPLLPSPLHAADPVMPAHVIDLSALWAGPLCAGLLALSGLPVTRLESAARPDPTPLTDPALDAFLNGTKQRLPLDLSPEALLDRLATARVLITSGRPHALARLGLTPERLFTAYPALLWVAITGHGWHGDAGLRTGFGDDAAAAGGLVDWADDVPRFIGDALADPLTGLLAARLALEALREGQAGLLDMPLAGTAARFARAAGLA